MNLYDPAQLKVLKRGYFLYDGKVKVGVFLVARDLRWGSGDPEDSPEVRDNHKRPWVEILYGRAGEPGGQANGGGGGDTLEEAVALVEREVQVVWDEG